MIVWAWRPVERRLDQSQRRSDAAAWADYTADLTDEQVDAKMDADPVFVRAHRHALDALNGSRRERDERDLSMTTTVLAEPEVGSQRDSTARPRESSARRASGGGTRRGKPRRSDDDEHELARHGGCRGVPGGAA